MSTELDSLSLKMIAKGFPRNPFNMDFTFKDAVGKLPNYANKKLRDWYDDLLTGKPEKPWLYLYGDVGDWKTVLVTLFCYRLLYKSIPFKISQNYDVYYFNSASLFDYLRFSYGSSSIAEWNRIKGAALLVIDDFGTEFTNISTFNRLYDIINHRYDAGPLLTIITSNHSVNAFSERVNKFAIRQKVKDHIDEVEDYQLVSDRIIRRLEVMSTILEV